MIGRPRAEGGGGAAIGFALLAVASSTALIVILRGTMAFWSVGMAGSLSRIVSVGLMAVWVGLRGEGWSRLRPRGMARPILLMGGLSIALNLCLFAGSQWTTATNAVLLFRSDLLFVLLIGALLGVEAVGRVGWAIAAVMLVGFGLLMEVQDFDWQGHARGDLLIILAALGLAANAFVIRRILTRMDGEAIAVYNHALSGVGFAALLLFEEVAHPRGLPQTPRDLWWIVTLGVVAAVSLPLYYGALRRLPVWELRVLMLLSAPLGALVDWVLWGVVLSPGQWWGGAILVGGATGLVLLEQGAGPWRCGPVRPDAVRAIPLRGFVEVHAAGPGSGRSASESHCPAGLQESCR